MKLPLARCADSAAAAAAAECDGDGGSSFLGVLLKKSNMAAQICAALRNCSERLADGGRSRRGRAARGEVPKRQVNANKERSVAMDAGLMDDKKKKHRTQTGFKIPFKDSKAQCANCNVLGSERKLQECTRCGMVAYCEQRVPEGRLSGAQGVVQADGRYSQR